MVPPAAADHACGTLSAPIDAAWPSFAEIAWVAEVKWPASVPTAPCSFPSTNCPMAVINDSGAPIPVRPLVPVICPIRANCMSMLIGYMANRAGMLP
ncbi:hypothetical protein C1Y40_05056 [Mycobacterium talmoniae]|uniref:Uncharacterized protein n=1 Tax=Mycobacterium talmoniae TaxID=1858794 RepID=A0A2S8BDP2_9MYCO|nr:hypothetical protein C1Y40_05056 [Mycobacterium talmoniae]